MKKRLITLAVITAAAAPLAVQADAKFYGQAQVEVATWGGDAKGTSVEDNARGRVGFKATEDLGDGLTGIAKFEFKVDTADGVAETSSNVVNADPAPAPANKTVDNQASLTKREMMVGLKGSFGTVGLGRVKTAYKYTGGVKYDPFTATVLEARGNNGMTGKVGVGALKGAAGHNSFVDDSISYMNTWSGVTLWVTYDLDDGGKDDDTGGNAMTASLKYAKDNWEVFGAMVDDDNDGASGKGYESGKVGGMVKFMKDHKVSAQYEMTDNKGTEADVLYLDYQFTFGDNLLDVAVGQVDIDTAGMDNQSFARVALKHKYSKTTSTWIGFRASDTSNTTDENVVSLGIRKDFM